MRAIRAKLLLPLVDNSCSRNKPLGYIFASLSLLEKCPCVLISSLLRKRVLSSARPVHPNSWRDLIMEWTTPQHEEIALNCEVSSYANAEL